MIRNNISKEVLKFLFRCLMIVSLITSFVIYKNTRTKKISSHGKDIQKEISQKIAKGEVVDPIAVLEVVKNIFPKLEKSPVLDKVYGNGVTYRQLLEDIKDLKFTDPVTTSEVLKSMLAELDKSGELDRIYSDGVSFKQILEEAKDGFVGPNIGKIIAGARSRGELDAPFYQGKSLNQILNEAKELSEKANAMPKYVGDTEYINNLSSENPKETVEFMIQALKSPIVDDRLYASQTFCDLDVAAYSKSAIPALKNALNDSDSGVKEFVQLALWRINFLEKTGKLK